MAAPVDGSVPGDQPVAFNLTIDAGAIERKVSDAILESAIGAVENEVRRIVVVYVRENYTPIIEAAVREHMTPEVIEEMATAAANAYTRLRSDDHGNIR